MTKKSYVFRKGLVIGIIVCFVGASVFPVDAINNQKDTVQPHNQSNDSGLVNFVGWVNITWDNLLPNPLKNLFPKVTTITPVPLEDRNYYFPVKDGKVKMNFSCQFTVEQVKYLALPRLNWVAMGFGPEGDVWALSKKIKLVWVDWYINPKTFFMICVDELERDTQGAENMTLNMHLEGGAAAIVPSIKFIDFPITAHFIYQD